MYIELFQNFSIQAVEEKEKGYGKLWRFGISWGQEMFQGGGNCYVPNSSIGVIL